MATRATDWFLYLLLILVVLGIICFFLKFGGYGEVLSTPAQSLRTVIGLASEQRAPAFDASIIDACFPVEQAIAAVQCSICLMSIEEGEASRQLQCSHVFHPDCISAWWIHRDVARLECPVCRRQQSVELPVLATELGETNLQATEPQETEAELRETETELHGTATI
eukprot:gnl/TRDRNA2_/TRDRNA2_183054_c0_seq1.p1 gnl/TRDRNA2_/TRDRNA2_183054_c0~~gnl/TRDRNA2_/TRDRNA2_183054_c0_seq1.p1  ORF type:complete len:167 (+),score=15.15 gnl/TRDRNA2_/TRDRNA2_183054_c0_seq1:107-607(+)